MKKAAVVLAALAIAFSNAAPAFAATEAFKPSTAIVIDKSARNADLAKVAEAFPEHIDKFTNSKLDGISPAQKSEIVIQETRTLANGEIVAYTEYSNGVGLAAIMRNARKVNTSSSTFDGYTTYSFGVHLTCTLSSEILVIEGVKVKFNSSATEMVNTGYISTASTTAAESAGYVKRTGTNNSNNKSSMAQAQYSGTFKVTFWMSGGQQVFLQAGGVTIYGNGTVEAF